MHEEALLAGIRAEPDDDLVRLAYADWLEEHDRLDEAELIRVQLGLAATPACERRLAAHLGDPDYEASKRRESELTDHLRRGAWADLASVPGVRLEIRRGLPEAVSIPADIFLANGERLLRQFPILSLELTKAGDRIEEILASPMLAGVSELSIEGECELPFAAFRQNLSNLRSLRLSGVGLGKQAIRALSRAVSLANLRRLTLRRCSLTRQTFDLLADNTAFARLDELRIESNGRALDWLDQLPAARFPRLRRLGLASLDGTGRQFREGILAGIPWLKQLHALDLSDNQLRQHPLAGADLSELRELNLSRCGLGHVPPALPRCERLELLDLSSQWTDPADELARWVARSHLFPALRELFLYDNYLTGATWSALVDSLTLRPDVILYLGHRAQFLPQFRETLGKRYRAVSYARKPE